MSLVVAYWGKTYQLWCSDGLTIEATESGFLQKEQTVPKIIKHPGQRLLCGWSGDRYDASVIAKTLLKQEPANSKSEFLGSFATVCKQINMLSQHYALRANEAYSRTGFIAGGYFGLRGFLAIITPEGSVLEKEKYVAIGYAAEIVDEVLRPRAQHLLTIPEAYELMVASFAQASKETEFVNKMIFPFLVTPHLLEDLSASTILHKGSYEERTNAHRSEIQRVARLVEDSTPLHIARA